MSSDARRLETGGAAIPLEQPRVPVRGAEPVAARQPRKRPDGLRRVMRGPALAGTVTILAFFGGFGGWATTAPLAGAALAPGTVSPDSQRKSVQHLEGGIVRDIQVREGSRVSVGDVLVTLLDTKASSAFEQDVVQKRVLQARAARLEAEAGLLASGNAAVDSGAGAPPDLTFPAELEESARANPGMAEILQSEREQFQALLTAYDVNLRILQQTIAKSRTEIVHLERQNDAILRQSVLMDEEIAAVEGLYKKQLENNSRVLSLKRERVEMDVDRAALDVRISGDRESIAATELEIENLRASRIQEIAGELATVRSDLQSIEEKMRANLDTLTRTTVLSPVDGTLVDVQVYTLGGVVAPGQVLMDIVPKDDQMIIDARIQPNDIDSVHSGQDVQVVLLAYPQRQMPFIRGTLVSVSADSLVDEEGESYFLGKVQVEPDTLKSIDPSISLMAGMEVELLIMTEERTFLNYLLDPIIRSVRRSFVET